ncbi:MAG: winged helix-turn-helix transcriptional regulator [archaeon]|jgi:uncharacterized membrane protein
MEKRTIFLLIPGLVVAAILFIGLLTLFNIPISPISKETCGCHEAIPNYFFLIFGIILIIAVIPISNYFSSKKMTEKLDKNMAVLSKIIDKKRASPSKDFKDREVILRFLDFNERKILEKLFETNGSTTQSEISRMEDMTKLRAHRAVKDLELKGIIKTQPYGKTNRIFLTREIKELLGL